MTIPYTSAPADPSLKDVLDQLRKDIFLSLNCHHIGTIQSFDPAKQLATATINYKKTFYQRNATTGIYEAVLYDYPIMTDCPVIVLGGANAALTFPITAGDECLVLFNDRDLDNWFQGGAGSAVATPRLHSFSDALVLVGIRSMGKVLDNYDASRAVLRNGSALVGVGETLIKLANENTTLKTLLNELIANVTTLVTQTAAITVSSFGAPPNNAAAITAVITDLNTTKADIAGLLE